MPTPERDHELEQLLAELPAREPSQMLDERIATTLYQDQSVPSVPGRAGPTEVRRPARAAWLMPMTAVAAAVVIFGLAVWALFLNPAPLRPETNPPVAHDSETLPDGPSSDAPAILIVSNPAEALDLTWTRDVVEETRYTPAGEPYRAVVREAVDHKAWIDTQSGETRQLRVPREELIVVKQMTF